MKAPLSVLVMMLTGTMLLAAQSTVLLQGQVTGCMGGVRYYPDSLTIYVYDAAQVKPLVDLLPSFRVAESNPSLYEAREKLLIRLVATSPRLGETRSENGGNFQLPIAASVKAVLVLAYSVSEDGVEPAYAVVELTKSSLSPVIVDYSPKFPPPRECPSYRAVER